MFMNGCNFFLLAIAQLFVFSFLLHASDTIDDNLGWRSQPMIIEIIDNEGQIFRQCAIEQQVVQTWPFRLSGILPF